MIREKRRRARRRDFRASPCSEGIVKHSRHRFLRFLLAAYVLAIIWTSFTRAAEFNSAKGAIRSSITPNPTSIRYKRLNVQAYVQDASKSVGVNPSIAEWIVSHESRHHPEATGDGGDSRGLWQINRTWHPEVSDACAYDVHCSTHWSLERIRNGYVNEWSTWKYCKTRFDDCPF
jgi:hypothetical protein